MLFVPGEFGEETFYMCFKVWLSMFINTVFSRHRRLGAEAKRGRLSGIIIHIDKVMSERHLTL